jgi:hypothetical protein
VSLILTIETEAFLVVGSVEVPLSMEQAERIILQHISEKDMVWCVQGKYYSRESSTRKHKADEWSVYPRPEGWILGNTHYRGKVEAECKLIQVLNDEIETIERHAAHNVEQLKKRIHEIIGTTSVC